MKKTRVIVAVILAVILLLALSLQDSLDSSFPTASYDDIKLEDLSDRIAALELAMLEETQARDSLTEQVEILTQLLRSNASLAALQAQDFEPEPDSNPIDKPDIREEPDMQQQLADRQLQMETRYARAGMDSSRVDAISQRFSELTLQVMQSNFEASQRGEGAERPWQRNSQVARQIREEIGDDEYDRYLYATNQPNRVQISQVIETSAGDKAGLKSGDVVLSYDNQRIFNMRDLVQHSRNGSSGEVVQMEVRRSNGEKVQLYLPRGPIGMQGRGRVSENPLDNGDG